MKKLMENWNRFLSEELLDEKLMLRPGPNGWDLYGKLVAEAYKNAPIIGDDSETIASFQAIMPFIENMYGQIETQVKIEKVPGDQEDPYGGDDKRMKREVAETGILKVWEGGTAHPMFSHDENVKFRVVHDWMAHIQRDTDFGMKGEIQAYNDHLKTMPPAAAPALFTEIVGQAAYFNTYKHFPEQKIAVLKGFDFKYIGVVDGYDIIETGPDKKTLIKREDNITPDIEDEEE